MRKLVESTLASLDGVIASPGRWSLFDEESSRWTLQELDNYQAFLMGRVTYEYFRNTWGTATGGPLSERINAMPKYVASRTLSEATWNATLLGPDLVGAIEQLKAQPGKDLIKWGSAGSTTHSCARRSSTSFKCGSCPSWSALASACSKTLTPPRWPSRSPTSASSPMAQSFTHTPPATETSHIRKP